MNQIIQTQWHVLNNGKPAVYKQKENPSLGWTNHIFDTLEEAVKYAKDYFYPYIEGKSDATIIKLLTKKEPYNYDGYGDTVQIVCVEIYWSSKSYL